MSSKKYDVIVVGARCAGASIALLLARAGVRVLLVDRARLPNDILSTHTVQLSGLACLEKWGLLSRLLPRGCQPYRHISMDFGDFSFTGAPPAAGDVADTICCRRTVLDAVLLEAAIEAGVEWRGGFPVQELITDNGKVAGILNRGHSKSPVVEKASLVIGADGMRSTVARLVNADAYSTVPSLTFSFYSYWDNIDIEHAHLYVRDGCAMAMIPTNDRATIVVVQQRLDQFGAFRKNIAHSFLQAWEAIPGAVERLSAGTRLEPFKGTPYQPNFFRKPWGDGWALVGDAGSHKDSVTAQGIGNTFYDAEFLADALITGLSGESCMDTALAAYHQKRDAYLLPIYRRTLEVAKLELPTGRMKRIFEAMANNPQQRNHFLGIDAGTVHPDHFFSDENIRLILAEVEQKPA
ncbi:MAG: FAD-dependent monooxygenase [Anaerolineales bacterium]|nr:FAD-dependent monooxygenase [Anaerolineales bacterium]MCB8953234.1 FAD-dependent monooxygenase [Ardenticatenales bacterium]